MHRNRRVPVDHPLPISSLPLYEKWKEEKYRNSSNRKGRVKNAQNYRCSDYRTAPTTLPLHSSPLLQKQSRPSRRDSPDSSLTFVNLSSPVYSDRTTGLGRRNIFSSESTNACRSFHENEPRARGRINRSARSLAEGIFIRLLVRGDLRAPRSYLDVPSHQFVDPSRFRRACTRSVHTLRFV